MATPVTPHISNMVPSIGPMQGVQPAAKAIPIRKAPAKLPDVFRDESLFPHQEVKRMKARCKYAE